MLVPSTLCQVRGPKRNLLTFLLGLEPLKVGVIVNSVTAAHFAGAPKPAKKTSITLLEEDKIMGYFGGGHLYATPARQEPLI